VNNRDRGNLNLTLLAMLCALLMLLPLGAYAFAHRRSALHLPVRQFAWGFVIAAVVLLAAGCLVGHGRGVWLESAQRLLEHGSIVAPNAIGLRIPLSASLANLRGDLLGRFLARIVVVVDLFGLDARMTAVCQLPGFRILIAALQYEHPRSRGRVLEIAQQKKRPGEGRADNDHVIVRSHVDSPVLLTR